MIRIEKLNKYYNRHKKNQIHVIDNTNIELPDKGLIALLGASGSGKTTLLNAIGGLDKVNSGSIYINDKKITKRNFNKIDKIRNLKIGYIFQDFKLVDNMTVFDNVAIVLKMIGIKDKEEINKRVLYVLEKVSMYRYRYRMCGMLSGGERQRVGIARAIVKNPDIILADEPTGNLDSKNTIEIMNIIKSISNSKLVLLVTHEVDLAKFYCDRIIDIVDGKISNDYINKNVNDLDYRIDNKFYLKDFKYHITNDDKDIKIDYYTDNKNKLNLVIVCKNGNLYIKNKDNEKIEVIDNNSSIEFVNDKYKSISKNIYLKYSFDFDKIINKDYKLRYSSIFNIFSIFKNGFNKVFNYSLIKKLLLIGFLLSSMFVTYSVSNSLGLLKIDDSKFISMDKNYLLIESSKNSVKNYLKYSDVDDVLYILPSCITTLNIDSDIYYQTANNDVTLYGNVVSSEVLSQDDLISGRLPSNEGEIVIDKKVYDNGNYLGDLTMIGYYQYSSLLDLEVSTGNGIANYKIVGFTDKGVNSIYVDNSQFYNLITNNNDTVKEVYDYSLYSDKIKITKGSIPNNNYEVIINEDLKDEFKIGKYIDKVKINGNKLKVVGYYSSNDINSYFVNSETFKYNTIEDTKNLYVYANDKEKVINNYKSINVLAKDIYEMDKDEYISEQSDNVKASLLANVIMLGISLIEIILMIRSSFLSRIKEVGIYRAIGVKKMDIYKMFIGESFAITTLTSVPGVLFMGYCINVISDISYIGANFVMNGFVIILCILIMYIFNILVGLIPVFNIMRKTPAEILSRYEVD